ncbi:MAG: extracellular solute-binding protein [Chloroflexi bacterium]|nr:extracellular solute-binding protein [Chloroflexota bacterium]
MDACGIVIKPESTRDQALLDTKVQAGTPPDIAFWNVTQLNQYKAKLVPMDQLGATKANYADFFTTPGTIDGKWLGLPVKADIKTIIWYSPVVFQAKGYTVPKTWDELNALVDKMAAAGDVPWSMGLESGDATGWTGSDFIQDLLLVQQGPQYVNDIISGQVAYNDKGVAQAYTTYGKWAKDPKFAVGGAQGTLSTAFLEAIYKPFADPPQAMMVKQSGKSEFRSLAEQGIEWAIHRPCTRQERCGARQHAGLYPRHRRFHPRRFWQSRMDCHRQLYQRPRPANSTRQRRQGPSRSIEKVTAARQV